MPLGRAVAAPGALGAKALVQWLVEMPWAVLITRPTARDMDAAAASALPAVPVPTSPQLQGMA